MFMTDFHHIFHGFVPYCLPPLGLELPDRRKTQHTLFVFAALCTLGVHAQVGQAGVGAIDPVQVSNHSPVPQYAVSAQPQMLLLVLDQQFDRPATQVIRDNLSAGSGKIVRHQRNRLSVPAPAREDDLDRAEFLHRPNPAGHTIGLRLVQPGDLHPLPRTTQNIGSVGSEMMRPAIDREPAVGLAHPDVMPALVFHGSGYGRAPVIGVKQHGNVHRGRQGKSSYRLGCEFRQGRKRNLQLAGLLFLDLEPTTPGNRDTGAVQAGFEDRVAGPVPAGGVRVELAHGRQHLLALERQGWVRQQTGEPEGRGRPAILWCLTDLAQSFFPERHAELTVGLIEAIRKAVGEEALRRVIETRADAQVQAYRKLMPPATAPLKKRVEALARQRTAEGYMAQVKREGKDAYLLIEHHCPICEAARCCQGLCVAELEVFQRTLGPDARIERTEHLLSDDRRCVYRIRPAS